jgi:ketosteroid isomerase-like protein
MVAGSLSQEDIDYIREGYRLFEHGDPAFLDRFTPDATLVFPETLPKGGTYGSPWEALQFWNTIGEILDDPHPEPEEFIRDGDRLVVLGHVHGRARGTGEQVAIRFAHVFTWSGEGPLAGRKATSFELICDTASFAAVLAGAEPG